MQPQLAKHRFVDYLARFGRRVADLTPRDGMHAMLEFYRDERADGCAFDDDADMLLFQWGMNEWDWRGVYFDIDITRQLIFGGDAEDENIWQLSLTFRFEPSASLRAIRSGNRWCRSLVEVASLEEFIRESPAFRAVLGIAPRTANLEYGCAG